MMKCERCGNETQGTREGGREYCTCCGADLGPVSTREAFQSLRDAGGDAWDKIDDPEAYLREMCGD